MVATFFLILTGTTGHNDPHVKLFLELLKTPNIVLDGDRIDGATCGRCGSSRVAGIADTVSTISAYCNVPVNQTLLENPGLNMSSNISNLLVKIPCSNNSAQCGSCGNTYTVMKTDTMDKIASTCGMQLLKLEMENQDVDFNNINAGQLLRLPCSNLTPPLLHGCGDCGSSYTDGRNKQLSFENISNVCSSTVEELSAANPGFNFTANSLLVQGQHLDVPCQGNGSCGPCGKLYTMVSGDDMNSVTTKCRVGLIELSRSNPGTNLKVGTTVNLPCTPSPPKPSCVCNSTYIVTKNMSGIQEVASQCNVTTTLISYANGISPQAVLGLGQTLAIPCLDSPPSELTTCSICGSGLKPTIMVNLATVATICNTSTANIKSLNNITLDHVGIGDTLKLPCEDPYAGCGACGIAYKAQPQDTLASIAVKCTTMPQNIQKLNQGINFTMALSGKLINIPCAFSGASTMTILSTIILFLMPLLW